MELCESILVRPIKLAESTVCHAAAEFIEISETLLCQRGIITLFDTRMLEDGEVPAITIPAGIMTARSITIMAGKLDLTVLAL
jgi:hypothetical protein